MNREWRKVKKWLDANRLALNIDKTNFVIFHSPRTKLPESIVIRFCRRKIQREKYVKFLGVLLDENLSWKYHINELSKKLSRTIGFFYRTRHFVYDCQNKLAPTNFHHYFVKCSLVHGYSTRLASRGDIFLERKNTFQYGIRSIEYNGARLWNMIPSHIREASFPLVFKNNLEKYFLTQYDST